MRVDGGGSGFDDYAGRRRALFGSCVGKIVLPLVPPLGSRMDLMREYLRRWKKARTFHTIRKSTMMKSCENSLGGDGGRCPEKCSDHG